MRHCRLFVRNANYENTLKSKQINTIKPDIFVTLENFNETK